MSDGMLDKAARAVGRAVHRLVHPHYAEEQERLQQLSRAVRELSTAQLARSDALRDQVREVNDRLDGVALDRDLRGLDRRVEQIREASARQYKVMSQALKRADWDEELRVDERRLMQRLARLKRSTQPVLVGPWSGEVGFELLYWIPFVTWALRYAEVPPERIFIMSRGGPQSWYAHVGGRYLDVLTVVTPEQFRERTEDVKKQRSMGSFDREMVRHAMRTLELPRPFLLHPGLMYRLFNPFWKQKATVRRIEAHAQWLPIARPAMAELERRLPREYVAVRFYFSACFPDTPANRGFVEATVRALSDSTDVVMLNTGFHMDDHRDYSPARAARIHSYDDLMVPERNLDVQTAIIAGARAFVGTYGGYSYLAPLLGVPSLAFYSVRDAFFAHHLELAERVFRQMEAGSLVPIDVRDADLVRMALSGGMAIRS